MSDFGAYKRIGAANPEVITNQDGSGWLLRFEELIEDQGRYSRSGKFFLLALSARDAIDLMGRLKLACDRHELDPTPSPTLLVPAPPAKDRN
jgi:hypothetical protein